jgi:putative Mg2+ transporter-C (MgtC) family protein
VRGLTTAATLWVVAAIGLAAGAGYYSAALMTTAVVVFLLWPVRIIARRLFERPHEYRLAVQLAAGSSASTVVQALERLGVRIESFEVGDADEVDLLLDLPRGITPDVIVRQLVLQQDVRSASWRT